MSSSGRGSVLLCDHRTLNTERTEHLRELSVEALEARRPQRTSIGCGPRPRCVLRPLPLRERGRGEGFLPATTPIHAVARFQARKKRPPVGVASGAKRNRASVFVIAMRTYSPLGLAGAVPLFLLLPAL